MPLSPRSPIRFVLAVVLALTVVAVSRAGAEEPEVRLRLLAATAVPQ